MSIARYSVVRYVPDPRREEYINIGIVLVTDDGEYARCRFTSNWSRAYSFGRQNTDFLADFAREMALKTGPQRHLFYHTRITAEVLGDYAHNWGNSIQFTEPKASLVDDPDELLNDLFSLLVVDIKRKAPVRSKNDVIHDAQIAMQAVIEEDFKGSHLRVERGRQIPGKVLRPRLDLVISNGNPWAGIEAFSFERKESSQLDTVIRAAAYDLKDIRSVDQSIPLAVILTTPSVERDDYKAAVAMYQDARADILSERDVDVWTKDAVRRALRERVGLF